MTDEKLMHDMATAFVKSSEPGECDCKILHDAKPLSGACLVCRSRKHLADPPKHCVCGAAVGRKFSWFRNGHLKEVTP